MRSSRSPVRVPRGRRVNPVHLGDEGQRLLRGQAIEERQVLGDDADAALDRDRIRERIETEDRHRAGGRAQQSGRHLMVVDLPAPFGPRNP